MENHDRRDWIDRVDRTPCTEEERKRAREGIMKMKEEARRNARKNKPQP